MAEGMGCEGMEILWRIVIGKSSELQQGAVNRVLGNGDSRG
jgi:hypothetical protein